VETDTLRLSFLDHDVERCCRKDSTRSNGEAANTTRQASYSYGPTSIVTDILRINILH